MGLLYHTCTHTHTHTLTQLKNYCGREGENKSQSVRNTAVQSTVFWTWYNQDIYELTAAVSAHDLHKTGPVTIASHGQERLIRSPQQGTIDS